MTISKFGIQYISQNLDPRQTISYFIMKILRCGLSYFNIFLPFYFFDLVQPFCAHVHPQPLYPNRSYG